jgi:hypothetical protein
VEQVGRLAAVHKSKSATASFQALLWSAMTRTDLMAEKVRSLEMPFRLDFPSPLASSFSPSRPMLLRHSHPSACGFDGPAWTEALFLTPAEQPLGGGWAEGPEEAGTAVEQLAARLDTDSLHQNPLHHLAYPRHLPQYDLSRAAVLTGYLPRGLDRPCGWGGRA